MLLAHEDTAFKTYLRLLCSGFGCFQSIKSSTPIYKLIYKLEIKHNSRMGIGKDFLSFFPEPKKISFKKLFYITSVRMIMPPQTHDTAFNTLRSVRTKKGVWDQNEGEADLFLPQPHLKSNP